MSKRLLSLVLLIGFCFPVTPATAVLNGQVTQTGKYVVPVHSAKMWCSGVAISTRVVITNGHCTRENNQVFTDISVGLPGSNQSISQNYIRVIEVITQPNFSYGSDRLVPRDDIAFLILESDLPSVSITRIATEADISELRTKGEVLLLQGYGLTGEGPIANHFSYLPSNGYFTIDNSPVFDSTLQSISSRSSSACNGDSGAPVIWENGKEVILLGVNVGGGGSASNCRKASADGIFRTEVQIPSRHSNILVNSIIKSSPTVGAELKTAIDEKKKLERDLIELRNQFALMSKEFDSAKSAAELKAKQESEAKAAAELKAKQEAEAKAAAELKAKQESEAKAASDKAALAQAQSELLTANAALADSQRVNREQALRINSLEEQFGTLSGSVSAFQSQISQLKSKILAAVEGQKAANTKLTKICSLKPKPKGC
jgi:hypothetical protein